MVWPTSSTRLLPSRKRVGASLYRLPELSHGILVVPVTTALHRLAPTRFLLGSSLVLDIGQTIDVEQMRTRLEASGYRCVDTVYEHGEFAVRGALIDLYPMGSKLPYRIDLFDDEIETLRTFDPETQRSIDKVDSVRLLPARARVEVFSADHYPWPLLEPGEAVFHRQEQFGRRQ